MLSDFKLYINIYSLHLQSPFQHDLQVMAIETKISLGALGGCQGKSGLCV